MGKEISQAKLPEENRIKAVIFDNEWVIVENDWDKISQESYNIWKATKLDAEKHELSFELTTQNLSQLERKLLKRIRKERASTTIYKIPLNARRIYEELLDYLENHTYKQGPLTGKKFKTSLQIPLFGGETDLLAEYSKGNIASNEFWDIVMGIYGFRNVPENQRKLQQIMGSLTTRTDMDAVETVKMLKDRNYKVFMLSNSNPDLNHGNRERDDYFDLFDHCYFSFEIGIRKPEPESYLTVLRKNNLQPAECLFIDDKQENLEAAAEIGIKTLHHKIGEGKLSDKLRYLVKARKRLNEGY